MSSQKEIVMNARTSILVLAPLLMALAGLSAATPAAADIIKKDDSLRGIPPDRAQCAAQPQAVWVNVDGMDFCVRYYMSTAGGEGPRPVVLLEGDHFGPVDFAKWQWAQSAKDMKDQDINTDDLMKTADGFSKTAKTTAIYLARMGVDGTSGNHVYRKTFLELHLMNAALEAIKHRYGFEGFHLAGQSGGSRLMGGLIGLRRDIACAVFGSGQLAMQSRTNFTDPARSYFDVMASVPSIAQNRAVRMMLVTDPRDQQVPPPQQTGFVEKMRQVGRQVPQLFVEATDEKHHGVVDYTRLAVAGCILGKSDREIAVALNTLVKRKAEYNERQRREKALVAGVQSPSPQAAAGGLPSRSASLPAR
jgi:hypothetical protein